MFSHFFRLATCNPIRSFLGNLPAWCASVPHCKGLPSLDIHGRYRGPLPPRCGQRHSVLLRSPSVADATGLQVPTELCGFLARSIAAVVASEKGGGISRLPRWIRPVVVPFCVSADVATAHRLCKVRKQDWPYLACRVEDTSSTIWVNTDNTFEFSEFLRIGGLGPGFLGYSDGLYPGACYKSSSFS